MPGNVANLLLPNGPLIGNGSVGVAIGGSAQEQEFYVGRDDFWSVFRGVIMPMGRLHLAIPALQNASCSLAENIGPAEVTADLTSGASHLQYRAWVTAGRNFFVLQLHNTGSTALSMTGQLLDGFGQLDQPPVRGVAGNTSFLNVSPDTVEASIGNHRRDDHRHDGKPMTFEAFEGSIKSVHIFDRYLPNGQPSPRDVKPLYAWDSPAPIYTNAATVDNTTDRRSFSCGNIIMPQRSFTVQAVIKVDRADTENAIFSAMAEHQWLRLETDSSDPFGNIRHGKFLPRTQGPEAGLMLYLSHGCLAANLNGTVLTAASPIPLQQWTNVGVSYDGMNMILLVDGKQIAQTRQFPTSAQVMGPQWQWGATHPGDPEIPFAGCAPSGILAMRVVGAEAASHDGLTSFTVPAGGNVTLLIAAMDDRDAPDYQHAALSYLQQADDKGVEALAQEHAAWWRKFWSESFIEIPDKEIQSWWYGSLYVLASCSEAGGNVPPGLLGNWITGPDTYGAADAYTLDYNYEAPFWAAYPTNHVSLSDSYDGPLLGWVQRGRGLAEDMHEHGLVYFCHLSAPPGWSSSSLRSLGQKSDALFAAVDCVQRWRYTRDPAYAEKVWPFLTGVADFWDNDLKWIDGHYVDVMDGADEHRVPAHDINPATTISFLQMLYSTLIDMSRQLHGDAVQDVAQRAVWQKMATNLSPLPVVPANSIPTIVSTMKDVLGTSVPPEDMVIRMTQSGMPWVIMHKERFIPNAPVAVHSSSAGMNSMQAVFPGWSVGLESDPALRQAAVNTVKYMQLWYDFNDTSSFYPAAADAGYDPDSILQHLHLLVTHVGFQNFVYNIKGGLIEDEATVPTTICAMLLQSYQKNIHVFPNWPKDQNASFGDLLACGDFLVSSAMNHGNVAYVKIISQRGGLCSLANPWPGGGPVQLQVAGAKTTTLNGSILAVPTQPGETLLFTPPTGH